MGIIRCCYIYTRGEERLQLRYVHDSTEVLTDKGRLNKQQPSAVIDRLAGVVAASDGPIKSHNGGNGAIDFFCRFFLVRLDVPRRVGADVDAVHHPAEDWMAPMGDAFL